MRFILLLLISSFVYSQNSDTEAAIYNMASNAIIGGVGALINKKPNEKNSKVFLKGIYQGALGGYLIFESKRLVRNFSQTENYAYVWPSKLLNSAGSSISYNAASNRNFWERWHLNFGFSNLEYDFKRDKRLRYRILPFALYGNINGFATGRFDLRRTLYTGQFVFKNNQIDSRLNTQPFAQAIVNTIQFDPGFNLISLEELIAHELIHVYQYNDYFAANALLKKSVSKLNQKSSLSKSFHKIFTVDMNYPLLIGIYNLQNISGVQYENIFYEREARYYSASKF